MFSKDRKRGTKKGWNIYTHNINDSEGITIKLI